MRIWTVGVLVMLLVAAAASSTRAVGGQGQVDAIRDALDIIENALWSIHRADLSTAETRQNGMDTSGFTPADWDTYFQADDLLFSEEGELQEDLSAKQLLAKVKEDDGTGEIDIVRDLLDIAEEMIADGEDASAQLEWAAERTSEFIDDLDAAKSRIAFGLIELNSLVAPPIAQTDTGTASEDARALLAN